MAPPGEIFTRAETGSVSSPVSSSEPHLHQTHNKYLLLSCRVIHSAMEGVGKSKSARASMRTRYLNWDFKKNGCFIVARMENSIPGRRNYVSKYRGDGDHWTLKNCKCLNVKAAHITQKAISHIIRRKEKPLSFMCSSLSWFLFPLYGFAYTYHWVVSCSSMPL